ncbi:MAG: hypothetical protein Q9N32_05930 [Gammaproteobacteria bacterium]|nr:hypothetical protein [Gammaproteobacteria bacterium]
MKVIILMITLVFIPMQSFARDSLPEVLFQLENKDENETLVWCFQVAYKLSDYQKKLKSGEIEGQNEVFCNAPVLDSDLIRGYLNKNHADEYITDDQALETIFQELEAAYPCVEK